MAYTVVCWFLGEAVLLVIDCKSECGDYITIMPILHAYNPSRKEEVIFYTSGIMLKSCVFTPQKKIRS